MIVSADKGKQTIVIDKSAYIEKCENHLSDQTTYSVLNCDPNPSL